jgi:hypothetical protein
MFLTLTLLIKLLIANTRMTILWSTLFYIKLTHTNMILCLTYRKSKRLTTTFIVYNCLTIVRTFYITATIMKSNFGFTLFIWSTNTITFFIYFFYLRIIPRYFTSWTTLLTYKIITLKTLQVLFILFEFFQTYLTYICILFFFHLYI